VQDIGLSTRDRSDGTYRQIRADNTALRVQVQDRKTKGDCQVPHSTPFRWQRIPHHQARSPRQGTTKKEWVSHAPQILYLYTRVSIYSFKAAITKVHFLGLVSNRGHGQKGLSGNGQDFPPRLIDGINPTGTSTPYGVLISWILYPTFHHVFANGRNLGPPKYLRYPPSVSSISSVKDPNDRRFRACVAGILITTANYSSIPSIA
jgi:hypothetical protein